MKRPALQDKQVGVLRMAFRARKGFGTFEKRPPGQNFSLSLCEPNSVTRDNAPIEADVSALCFTPK